MIVGIIIGVAIGYFFKPQLDEVAVRIIKKIKKAKVKDKHDEFDQ